MHEIINYIKNCHLAPNADDYKRMFVGVDMTSIVDLMPHLLRFLIDYWWQHFGDGIAEISVDIYNNAIMVLGLAHSEYYHRVVMYAFRRFLRYWWPRGNDKMLAKVGMMTAFEIDKVKSASHWIKIFLKLVGTIDKFDGYTPRYSKICILDNVDVIDIVIPKTIHTSADDGIIKRELIMFDICRYIWRCQLRINSVMYIVTEYYDAEFMKPIVSSMISRFGKYCRLFQDFHDVPVYGVIMSILIFHYDLRQQEIQTLLRFVATKTFANSSHARISEAIQTSMQRHRDCIDVQRIIIDSMYVATMNMCNRYVSNVVMIELIKLKANNM